MKLVSKKPAFQGESKIIGEGLHQVIITAIAETLAKVSEFWADQTPQIEVDFEDANGKTLKHWFNQKGYKTRADFEGQDIPAGIEFRSSENGNEEYAVDTKTNMRIESESKTAECENMLAKFAYYVADENAGVEVDIQPGSTVGIMVRENARGYKEVHYFKGVTATQAELEKSVEA